MSGVRLLFALVMVCPLGAACRALPAESAETPETPDTTSSASAARPWQSRPGEARSTPEEADTSLRTDRQLGQRFRSVAEFAAQRYPSFPADENLRIQPVPGTNLVWLRDTTPRVNGTWHLFGEVSGGGVVYLLCHADAEWVEVPPPSTNPPIQMVELIQPDGFTDRVSYEFSPARGYYVPVRCSRSVRIDSVGGSRDTRAAPEKAESREIPWDCQDHLYQCD